MKLQASTLRTQRKYEAEELQFLFRGLNNTSPSIWKKSTRKRVLDLIADLRGLESVRRQLRKNLGRSVASIRGSHDWPWFDYRDRALEKVNRRGERLIREVNNRLSHYAWSPAIHAVDFSAFQQRPNWRGRNQSGREEKIAVWVLVNALTTGSIDRFRSCSECDRWFYALAEHQRYCSDTCRKKYASRSTEFKTKRRNYMRTYRQQESARDIDAKDSASMRGIEPRGTR